MRSLWIEAVGGPGSPYFSSIGCSANAEVDRAAIAVATRHRVQRIIGSPLEDRSILLRRSLRRRAFGAKRPAAGSASQVSLVPAPCCRLLRNRFARTRWTRRLPPYGAP